MAIWVLGTDARREIDDLATASGDSSQWSLAQTEVEFLALESAVLAVLAGRTEDLSEVRKRYDIYYSRLQIAKTAAALKLIREIPSVVSTIQDLQRFIDSTVELIDGDDEALRAALPDMASQLAALKPHARALSLAGVRVFAERSVVQRDQVSGVLYKLAWSTALLLALLLCTVVVLQRISAASQRKTREIAKAESHLQAIVSSSIDAIIVTTQDGTIRDFNGAAERIFGYTRDVAIGRRVDQLLISEPARADFRRDAKALLSSHIPLELRESLSSQAVDMAGRHFPIEFSASQVETPDEVVVVTFIRDISVRVAAQDELVDALDRAVEGEKAKSDMLGVMSHEMRTPLNGVLGTLELLTVTELTDEQTRLVEAMSTSGQHLLEHVNNVLDMLRVDGGKAEATPGTFDVMEVVNSAVDGLRYSAGQRGNEISVTRHDLVPKLVFGDSYLLQRVLTNLLGNAIKFTENGSISVEVEAEHGSDEITFRIADTGIGIPEQELERIFEDFVTLDTSYQREMEGTGLGLGIVRRVMQILGGDVGVESQVGEGAVFWVRLPLPKMSLAASQQSLAALDDDMPALGASVLVVEDNKINRLVVSEMLSRMGCQVTEAVDGAMGIEIAARVAFDLILMDISMPKVDGIEACRQIKVSDGPNRTTPIVALTAHAGIEVGASLAGAEFDEILTKPLSIVTLRDTISEILDGRPPVRGEMTGSAAQELSALIGADRANQVRVRVEADIRGGLEALRDRDSETCGAARIAELAHRLCGSAGLVGMSDVHDACREIEAAARAGDVAEVAGLVEVALARLDASCAAVSDA